jgi:hypothetical protein
MITLKEGLANIFCGLPHYSVFIGIIISPFPQRSLTLVTKSGVKQFPDLYSCDSMLRGMVMLNQCESL